MLWQGRRQSSNVDDRRGVSGGQVAVGGGILGVIALVLNFLLGGDGNMPQIPMPNQAEPMTAEQKAAQDQLAGFVKTVMADTEDIWGELFSKSGNQYQHPTLVLFNGGTQSGCGSASSATG